MILAVRPKCKITLIGNSNSGFSHQFLDSFSLTSRYSIFGIMLLGLLGFTSDAFADVDISINHSGGSPDPTYIQNGEYVTFTFSSSIVDACDGETVYYGFKIGHLFGESASLMIHEINSPSNSEFTPTNPLNWPSTQSQATYKITFTCDPNGAASGAFTHGNGVHTIIQSTESSQPNLVVSSMTHLPANPDIDDLMTFTATVTNEGVGPASATTLMFKIGGETPGVPATLFDIPALAAGVSSVPVERVLTLDVAQNYRNTATADYFEVVEESNEADNTSTHDFTVGDCLIATAAFGSPMAYEVQLLREIRDNQLLQTQSGSAFMTGFNTLYYSFAPTVADWERENLVFKEAVKATITPLITSLSLLHLVDMDSEAEVLGYGIGVILLNIGMYFVAPAILITKLRQRFSR